MPSHQPPLAPETGVAFPVLQLSKLELCFRDGSRLWLRQITTDPLKRAIDHAGEELQIDLRRVDPTLENEVSLASHHDRPGVIFFTLRQHFKTDCDFIRAVQQLA